METILETRNLCRRFGGQMAVDDVSLEVRRGDVYGFLGLNGAGKTTTLRMVLGLLRPTSGTIQLFGQPALGHRRASLGRIGAMVENPAFFGQLGGAANLRHLGRLSGPVPEERIREILELVGLADAADKKAKNYSLGMKQRLAIGLALISAPELVILDEPTNGLDPSGILEMRRLIQRLNREQGVTFVISSHLLHEIEMTCTRVGILEEGRLVIQESLEGLMNSMHGRRELVARPADQVRGVLESFEGLTDLEATDTDGGFLFSLAESEVPSLHRALHDAGAEVYGLAERRMSLEEHFLARAASHAKGKLS
ncbi:MAG: ATP-binding cassette domain-containing protein [Planctomycetes bacterium]|nr:ATP-binding cassette domain-containing protein [Planctomycetota bacterium]